LETMLVYLGQERGISSIYSVSKGNYPNSKNLIKAKRALFSKSIQDLRDFINVHPELYNDVKDILNMTNKLPIIRKKIDSFKQNYIKTYFFSYYTVLENKILKAIAKTQKKFPQQIQKLYALKFPFERIISFSGIIRGFGSYYITADTPMSQDEYKNVLMKYYHDTNILPTLLLNKKAQSYLTNSQFKKNEKDIKTVMFYIEEANMQYYIDNQFNGYPIDALDYFNIFTKRISYFNKVLSDINNQIANAINSISTTATKNLIINAIILLISVLMFIIGIYIVKLIKLHIKELSDLITSLTPITGKAIEIDIGSTKGINEAVKIVDEAIKIIQESVKKAEEATKAKSLFLANMSHEIRTPLNGILGFLEILKTTELTPEQEEYVNTIAQSAKNLLQIVNNILDVSKIESNKVTLEIIDFKAVDEFENTLEIFSTPAANKNIQYVAKISPNIPTTLKGDILKIKEILTNLINNAIKFTHENGLISVKILLEKIENNKATLYFEVKDTGIGMSEEQKEKIFEAFAQADESVTRKYGGTGLGLTIVKSYLEMMGSHIEIESEINKGSKFYFTLELEIADPAPRYKENTFNNITFAVMNTFRETYRKEFTIDYLTYFGIQRIGFNDVNELNKILNTEKIHAVLVFTEESNQDEVFKLKNLNIPIITVSSFSLKETIDKINPEITIYDPNVPSKTYNAIKTSQEQKVVIHKQKVKEEKPVYKLKALIAEDNPINQKLLKTKLKSMGIEADTANNGLEAFNKYSMNPDKYDVIFMDVQMPIMDGVEATQEIIEFEKEEEIPHTPIIAVTANVLKGDRERFIGAGMDDYISKPIEQKELQRVIDNIIKHKYSNMLSSEQSNQTIQDNNVEIKEIKPENFQQPTESAKTSDVIIAAESTFLINYLKNLIDIPFETARNIKELDKKLKLNPHATLIIEEEFNDANLEVLINSIKQDYPDIKIFVIGETNYPNANDIISDLNPETIKKIIDKIKGNK
ncbi:ATP-binding protein, partial [Caminibacter sp.]